MAADEQDKGTVLAGNSPVPVTAGEPRDILSSHAPFGNLSESTCEALATIANRMFVPAGQRIFSVGDFRGRCSVIRIVRVNLAVIPGCSV